MATFVWAAAIAGNWSVGANWQVGGVPQIAPPTAADDVVMGSGTGATNSNCTVDGACVCRSLDQGVADYTGTLATGTSANSLTIGDGTAGAGNIALRISTASTFTGTTSTITFASTSATQQTINSGGKTLMGITINGAGSSYILGGNLTIGAGGRIFNITAGTFNDGGYAVSFGKFNSSNSNTRTITATGNWTCTDTAGGTAWTTNTSTNLTWSFTGTLTLGGSGTDQTVTPGGLVFGAISITTTANVLLTGSVQTTNNFTVTSPKTITVTNGRTITVGGQLIMTGSSGNVITILSSSAGSAFTFSKSSGIVSCDWLSLKDSTASGGATFYAGNNSTNVSGNTGWIFTAPPSSGFFMVSSS